MTPEAIELGRAFLITLVHGVRTAVHTPEEQPLEEAAESVHAAADALFNATGGFSVKFTEASAILNDAKIPFDGGNYGKILRERLAARGLTSIGMKRPPSVAAIKKLISIFVGDPTAPGANVPGVKTEDLSPPPPFAPEPQVVTLPVEASPEDPRTAAVEAFARIVLALRELRAFIEESRMNVTTAAPMLRHHLARALADLIDAAQVRADAPIVLAAQVQGAAFEEARAAGTASLSIAFGQALGLPRSDLLDIGLAAALQRIGRADAIGGLGEDEAEDPERTAMAGSIARVLGRQARAESTQTVAFIIAGRPHPFSSIVRAAEGHLLGVEDLTSLGIDPRMVEVLEAVLHPDRVPADAPEPPPAPAPAPETPRPRASSQVQAQAQTPSRETVHRAGGKIRLPWLEKKPKE